MKKLISMLLAIIMVMSVVSVSAAVDTEGYNVVAVFEDINDKKFTTDATLTKVENDPERGSYYSLSRETTARNYAQSNDCADLSNAKYIKITMKAMLPQVDVGCSIAAYNKSKSTRGTILEFWAEGYAGDNAEAVYEANEWMDIAIYIDVESAKSTTYVDGICATNNKDIPNFTNRNLSVDAIRIMLQGVGTISSDANIAPANSVFNFDDVRFYVSDIMEPDVKIGDTVIEDVPVFYDDFTYEGVDSGASLISVAAFSGKYDKANVIKNKVAYSDGSVDFALEHNSTTQGSASLIVDEDDVIASDADFASEPKVYFSFKFYPTAYMKRNLYMYITSQNGRPFAQMDNTNGYISFRSASGAYDKNVAYNLNSWNTLRVEIVKNSNENKFTYKVYMNDNTTPAATITDFDIWSNKTFTCFGIVDTENKDAAMYIDDIEIGKITETTPVTTTYPDTVLGQGTDNAVIFTSYEASNGETTVTPIIAAYKNDELVSVNVLDPKDLTAGAVRIKGSVKTGTADEYKVFFLQSKEVINPLDEAISIIK